MRLPPQEAGLAEVLLRWFIRQMAGGNPQGNLTKDGKLRWDVAKWRSVRESREQH